MAKKAAKPSNVKIHMQGTYGKWTAATTTSSIGYWPVSLGFDTLPHNGWQVPDIAAGGNLTTGTTGVAGFVAGQGGKLDNQLRFMEEELFIPTNVTKSHVGTLEPWLVEDSAGTPAVLEYWPQTWSKVPHAKEIIYISTDSRMLDGWQNFAAGRPYSNPLFSSIVKDAPLGEQPFTMDLIAGSVPGQSLFGDNTTSLGKLLYASMTSYQGGNASSGFQQTGQEVWGGGQLLAAESLYWMRIIWLVGTPNIGTGTGNEHLYFKIPDLNLTISGVNADQGDLSFIMGLRQNLGSN
jgi:hypothetical protein